MSNVSQVAHTVQKFVAGESKPLSGQWLAKVGYKSSKNQPAKFPSICVSLPQIPVEMLSDSRFHPYFVEFLEQTTEDVIRKLYESRNGSLDRVLESEINADALAAFLAAKSAGERISGDSIGAWFDSQVASNLLVIYAEKLGYSGDELTQEQEDTLLREVGKVKNICLLMAAHEIRYSEGQKKIIQRCFDIASGGIEEGFGAKLSERFKAQCGKADASVLEF